MPLTRRFAVAATLLALAACGDAPTRHPALAVDEGMPHASAVVSADLDATAPQFRWLEPVGTGGNALGRSVNSAAYLPFLRVELCAPSGSSCTPVANSAATAANGQLGLAAAGKEYRATLRLRDLGLSAATSYRVRALLVDPAAPATPMQVGYFALDAKSTNRNLDVRFIVGAGIPRTMTLTVTGGGTTLNPGDTRTLTVAALGWDGAAIPVDGVTWSSSSGAVTVTGTGSSALVTAVGTTDDPVTITAAAGSFSASIAFTVASAVHSVTVTPATVSIGSGTSTQLTATVRAANGSLITGRPITWTSSDASAASVDAMGVVRALTPGTTPVTITATVDGVQGVSIVTVTPGVGRMWLGTEYLALPAGSAAVSPISVSLATSAGIPISTVGKTITWSSSNTGVATVSDGFVTAVGAGWAIVSAACEGRVASAVVIVTPTGGSPGTTVGSVLVVPFQSTLNAGDSLKLFAIPLDAAGNALHLPSATRTWNSGSTSAVVRTTGYVVGIPSNDEVVRVTITATIAGVSGTGYVDIVSPPPPQPPTTGTIVVTPNQHSMNVGGEVTLTARVYDSNGAEIANPSLAWTSGNTAVASVLEFSGATARVRAVGGGSAQITVSTGSLAGYSVITVIPPVVVPPQGSLVITAPGYTPDATGKIALATSSGTITLSVQLVYADGTIGPLPSLAFVSSSSRVVFPNPSQPTMTWNNTTLSPKTETVTVHGGGYTGSRVFILPNP